MFVALCVGANVVDHFGHVTNMSGIGHEDQDSSWHALAHVHDDFTGKFSACVDCAKFCLAEAE